MGDAYSDISVLFTKHFLFILFVTHDDLGR